MHPFLKATFEFLSKSTQNSAYQQPCPQSNSKSPQSSQPKHSNGSKASLGQSYSPQTTAFTPSLLSQAPSVTPPGPSQPSPRPPQRAFSPVSEAGPQRHPVSAPEVPLSRLFSASVCPGHAPPQPVARSSLASKQC